MAQPALGADRSERSGQGDDETGREQVITRRHGTVPFRNTPTNGEREKAATLSTDVRPQATKKRDQDSATLRLRDGRRSDRLHGKCPNRDERFYPRTRSRALRSCLVEQATRLIYSCWLLRGQHFLVGMGGGLKRLNILGAYCPQDHEYLDLRVPKGTISAAQVIELLTGLQQRHSETKKFILYLDNARYQHARLVREWVEGPEGAGGGIRTGLLAGVLAEPEPDRVAVEVPAQARPATMARDLRSDAGGGGAACWITWKTIGTN